MQALICGSFAYDNIMVFGDRFKNHILPDKVHILNVSFLVPEMRREFGGCAGNIAYNLKLLGGAPLPMGTVGEDFTPYAEWMDECGIDRRHVTAVEKSFTAQAFVTTDLDDNQITAFHPGAMGFAERNKVESASGVSIGIVSPDGREGMIEHSTQFAEAGIPFIFDPGQGLPMFDGKDLCRFIEQATWLTVNDYEWQLVQERTGLTAGEVASSLEALIVTRGAKGSVIYTGGKEIDIPAAATGDLKDPTGCGDAYRAGLLYGLMNDLDWETTGRIASLMGAIKIEHSGTQNHSFTREEFAQRFEKEFGTPLPKT
ncbi:MAG: carbohydrate kinase family protein [Desulfuromonadales bacterium]|nr:carbohydrate kinase family protein [Desulfuromonadales bacterium]NIR33958.1 carbohydrate kinase family protein [Desulfuromonadales bacterium]NIS41506.1 carbohydrate kinase family protein [Desulfuromonadales bacterium]